MSIGLQTGVLKHGACAPILQFSQHMVPLVMDTWHRGVDISTQGSVDKNFDVVWVPP